MRKTERPTLRSRRDILRRPPRDIELVRRGWESLIRGPAFSNCHSWFKFKTNDHFADRKIMKNFRRASPLMNIFALSP